MNSSKIKGKKKTERLIYYGQVFDLLMDWASQDMEMPVDVVKALDQVANYAGDVASGRRK